MSTVQKVLRKRAYWADYNYKGVTYHGLYEPIISAELWEEVQAVLEDRHPKRPKKRKYDFAFSHLITCGHRGCAIVGEIKKVRYVYYDRTDTRGSARSRTPRSRSWRRRSLLEGISFSEEALEWVEAGTARKPPGRTEVPRRGQSRSASASTGASRTALTPYT